MTARMKITGIILSFPICLRTQTYLVTQNSVREGKHCHAEKSTVKKGWQLTLLIYYTFIMEKYLLCFFSFSLHRFDRVEKLTVSLFIFILDVTLTSLIMYLCGFFHFQCDTSAQGGSPSSTLTCSTASPCSESPSSTLSTSAGGQPLPQPLPLPSPHCSSSPSGTLSSPVRSPAPGATTGSSPGPPSQSPTSTLGSKDSGIIGESCCCCVSVGNPCQVFKRSLSTLCEFRLVFTLGEACPIPNPGHALLEVKNK